MNLLEHCLIPDWPAPGNVRALQTTRKGGFSAAPYDRFNLGSHVGDAPLAVARNRALLQSVLPTEPVWLKQVHETDVVDASFRFNFESDTRRRQARDADNTRSTARSERGSQHSSTDKMELESHTSCWPQADGCIASRPGAVCVVMTADCLPVLLCDDKGSVVGAAHAGWRGLCEGVIERTIQAMDVPPQALMAWLGPAIGPQAFEVGDEVRAAFVARQPAAAEAFVQGTRGKWLADIYALARLRLQTLGIKHIYGGGLCTYSDRENFFSYRRDGATGRMGTFIWMDSVP